MKYPIILVHGIAIKDYKFIKAFGNIEHLLQNLGYIVYTTKHDSFGTIENNAQQIKDEILEIMHREKSEKVNIIAHSKGGLDVKYMIENLNMENKIASLTTLCTPFKGSIIASLLLKLPNFIKHPIAFFINFWYRIFKDKFPDALKVCEQLQKVEHLEIETLKIPHTIYCQSYSTTLHKASDNFLMGVPLKFSKWYEDDHSDGLVSNESSKFENYKGSAINDSISHCDIIDFLPKKKKKEKIYSFYVSLCHDLEERGF